MPFRGKGSHSSRNAPTPRRSCELGGAIPLWVIASSSLTPSASLTQGQLKLRAYARVISADEAIVERKCLLFMVGRNVPTIYHLRMLVWFSVTEKIEIMR